MKKKGEKEGKVEEVAEDWCFECYDGGLLLVCEYKHCLKSYHADCVGKDESFIETGEPWFCRRHSCSECGKGSKYQCFGCPTAVCQRCIDTIEFARVRGNKGFCNNCLKLALLGEQDMNIDSDGEHVDFKDLDTCEGLFFDYWRIIRDKEGLTLEDLQSADMQLKKGGNYKTNSRSQKTDTEEEEFQLKSGSDDDDGDDNGGDLEELKLFLKRKRSIGQKPTSIPKSKNEIKSWGSDCLIGFLKSIGRDTSSRYEQHRVASIIIGYAEENNLFHPEKKRRIVCDEKLKCLLGRKMVDRNKIVDLLEPHFPENLESSEEEEEEGEINCIPKGKEESSKGPSKKPRNLIAHKNPKKEVPVRAPQRCFACIVSENMKLVYLKKSLVEELSKQPETFESKVVGSFVRVRSDPRRYFFQLLQVTGVKKVLKEENRSEILLQVSTLTQDISINLLSDDNFSEDDCEDLRKKVKAGLVRRPTMLELEQKARILHEDIIKHWIAKELVILQHRIDRANEKGWRREFFECLELQRRLQTPEEQVRMLRRVPNVIPDLSNDEPVAKDATIEEDEKGKDISKGSILPESSETCGSNGEENEKSSVIAGEKEETKHDPTTAKEGNVPECQMNAMLRTSEEKEQSGPVSSPGKNLKHCAETCLLEILPQQSHYVAPQVEDKMLLECELFQ